MGFWSLYKNMIDHDEQVILEFIENLYSQGKISQQEAEERRREVEEGLHKIFDTTDDEPGDAA